MYVFKFSQLSAGCSESFLPQRHVYKFLVKSQVPNVQGSSLSPPSALEELNLTLRRLSQVSKVSLVSLALKIIDLLSFHDMISTLHTAEIIFYQVMFNFNSNDRDDLTQSLLTLWIRIDLLDNLCSTNYTILWGRWSAGSAFKFTIHKEKCRKCQSHTRFVLRIFAYLSCYLMTWNSAKMDFFKAVEKGCHWM